MTLLPSDQFGVSGWPGNAYKVNEVCAHPSCGKASVHAHHMWRRSFIRKDYDWVKLPDGTIIGNRVGLCQEHHDMVTGEIGGYRAKLTWEAGIMWWEIRVESAPAAAGDDLGWHVPKKILFVRVGPLSTQPPAVGRDADVARSLVDGHVEAHGHVADEVCPTCGHHTKSPDEPRAKLPRRNTKEWTISVPDDAEIGADVIEGMIEDFAIPLGATEWSSRLKRYHVLVAVLAWATANRSQFIADVAEAAERRLA